MCNSSKSNGKDAGTLLDRNESSELREHEKWLVSFDFVGFTNEIRALGKELEAQQGRKDVDHLNKMIFWSNAAAVLGFLTMGFSVNLFTIVALSLYSCSRFTMIAHHICHGGYENCHPQKRWSRFRFALGSTWRRFHDWFDVILPEAWNVEHNNRHHYYLSENQDPDLVEQNLEIIRQANMPLVFKYIAVFLSAISWKLVYYAPNTYKELKLAKLRKEGKAIPEGRNPEYPVAIFSATLGTHGFFSPYEFWSLVLGPYLVIHFLLTPAVYHLIGHVLVQAKLDWSWDGPTMFRNAFYNLLFAELLTNVHSFCIITPNHAGDDMYRFRQPCRPYSGSFYLRQVLASANMTHGNDVIDFLHGWLSYQIEHHLYPNLSMLQYQKAAPRVRAICAKYGVPYVQQSVFERLQKTVDIMVGNTSMLWFPASYEQAFLRLDANLLESRKSQN